MVSEKDIREVFQHWKTYHPRQYPVVSGLLKEWLKVAARLKEGYTVEALKEAIDGMHRSPHNLGENERGRQYLTLELCMRNATQVERYREVPLPGPVLSERTQRSNRAIDAGLDLAKSLLGGAVGKVERADSAGYLSHEPEHG